MGVNSLPNTVTRQRRACNFWTQALLRMSPAWVQFHVYNTGLVEYRWTGLDQLTADRLKMQDWKIVNSSKYSLSCCTYVFHCCRFVHAFSTLAYSYLRIPYLHIPSSGTFVFRTCVFSRPDKGCLMIRMGVSGWMFLMVQAYQKPLNGCVCRIQNSSKILQTKVSHHFKSGSWC